MQCTVVKSYTLKICLARAMKQSQTNRTAASNRDLLLSTLSVLKEALEKMNLPDFFDESFNHFHRNKDRKTDARNLAWKIGKIIESLDSHILKLNKDKKKFIESVSKFFSPLDYRSLHRCSEIIEKEFPWISRAGNLKEIRNWLMICSDSTKEHLLSVPLKEKKPWQPILRKKYETIFSSSNIIDLKNKMNPSDALSRILMEKFVNEAENRDVTLQKLQIWSEMEQVLQRSFPECCVAGFGSSFNGFASTNCDLDLCVYIPNITSRVKTLSKIRFLLGDLLAPDSEVIKAKVPVLKAVHAESGIPVDIVVSPHLASSDAVRSSHLFYYCSRQDWRVRPLVSAVKVSSININGHVL